MLAGHKCGRAKRQTKHGKMKRYNVIVKLKTQQFLKYKVNDLLKFTAWLDKKYTGQWTWYNVFDSKTRLQVGNFTNKNRPILATI